MKATCPNDPKHKQFVTVAVVQEDWLVDEHGDFIEVHHGSECHVSHGPDPANTWNCADCGAEALVE